VALKWRHEAEKVVMSLTGRELLRAAAEHRTPPPALAAALGHALVDGQLYFAGQLELMAAALLALPVRRRPALAAAPAAARPLLPRYEQANALPAWRWHLTVDLLTALAMAIGTATLGLMGAFALVFVPPWLAFRRAASWRRTLLLSALVGTGGYLMAFALALGLDQPFGPVLVATLLLLAAAAAALPQARKQP
jgi:zinc/manganese transport system permease protein